MVKTALALFEFGRRDREDARAEFAIDLDKPVLVGHRRAFVRREFGEHRAHMIGIAAAAPGQRIPGPLVQPGTLIFYNGPKNA